MSLPGDGFLAMWNDVAPEAESEWLDWHTREHMRERVGVPGFLAGRRYIDWGRDHHRLFTLYTGESVATFSSPPYLERLNNPTPWTTSLAPHYRDFLRGACRRVASAGDGLGGALLTVRVDVEDSSAIDGAAAEAMLARLIAPRGLLQAHLGVQDTSVSGVQTKEKALRGDKPVVAFGGVILVDGESSRELAGAESAILRAIEGAGLGLKPVASGVYVLSISLTKSDLKG